MFTIDEMLNIALCKNAACFEKTALANGYKKINTTNVPATIKEIYTYKDPHLLPDGTQNSMSWIVFNDKNGLHNYADFSSTDKNWYNNAATVLKQRGYGYVKNNVKDLGDGFLMMTQWVRKNNTGIQNTITDMIGPNKTRVTVAEISITIPCTPNWPDDE